MVLCPTERVIGQKLVKNKFRMFHLSRDLKEPKGYVWLILLWRVEEPQFLLIMFFTSLCICIYEFRSPQLEHLETPDLLSGMSCLVHINKGCNPFCQ